jgi:uncharacterized SAM-binding protein YcdF (DUF218 family)
VRLCRALTAQAAGFAVHARRLLQLLVLSWLSASCAASSPALTQAGSRDAVVVLGHRPARDAHGLEAETEARVSRGIALYREGKAPRLVFTGGHTSPGASEAEIMGAYAESQGVPAQALRLETHSHDTIENARFTVDLLSSELARAPRVLLVTSDYHVKRASALFRCAGADVTSVGVPLDALSFWQRFTRRSREAFVHVAYWFMDECARVRGE